MLATRGARLALAVNGPARALTALPSHRIPPLPQRQQRHPFVCFQCRSTAAEATSNTTPTTPTDAADKPKQKRKRIRRSSADVTAEMHAQLAAAEAAVVALAEREKREKMEKKEREKVERLERKEREKEERERKRREREERKQAEEQKKARKREEKEKGMTEEEKTAFRAKEEAKKERREKEKEKAKKEGKPKRVRKKKTPAPEPEPEPEPVRRRRPSPKRDAAKKALEVKRAARLAARQLKVKHNRVKSVRPRLRNMHVSTPLAERLEATGLWKMRKAVEETVTEKKKKEKDKVKEKVKGDKHRVNIVGEKLVDDVLDYIGSTLTPRHAGCDIIDIYPGAGLWSTKLHDLLQPRKHILLEPDVSLYTPYLQPLLDKPNVTLVPKAGIIWRELSNVLTPEYLPHQTEKEIAPGATPTRNDTLLVTANLAFFPRRRFGTFESVSQLVLYQFINSIRASSLFNKYGLVRMLIWVEANDRHAIIARSIQRRKRLAIDGEVTTEYIAEVVGPDDVSPWFIRDSKLDLASTQQTLERMDKAGITIPPGREPKSVLEFRKLQAKKGRKGKGKAPGETPVIDMDAPPRYERPFLDELRDLAAMDDAGLVDERSKTHRRLTQLQYRATHEAKVAERVHDMWKRMEEIADELETKTANGEDLASTLAKQDEWNSEFDGLSNNDRNEFVLYRDNHRLFNQNFSGQKPVLAWDRRPVEPLVGKDDEFFPNAPCALIDIQPKVMNPLFRTVHSQSAFTSLTAPAHISQASDVFEAILRSVMGSSTEPISKSLETVWPGAAEGVLPNCPSLRDRAKGGTPVGGPYGELSGRSLNEEQWAEVVGAWMRWPFRPSLPQLVGRISEDANIDDDENLVD